MRKPEDAQVFTSLPEPGARVEIRNPHPTDVFPAEMVGTVDRQGPLTLAVTVDDPDGDEAENFRADFIPWEYAEPGFILRTPREWYITEVLA